MVDRLAGFFWILLCFLHSGSSGSLVGALLFLAGGVPEEVGDVFLILLAVDGDDEAG